jgi:hypothetical protein
VVVFYGSVFFVLQLLIIRYCILRSHLLGLLKIVIHLGLLGLLAYRLGSLAGQ